MSSRLASARMKANPEVVLNAVTSEEGPSDLHYASAALRHGGMAAYIQQRLKTHVNMVLATVSEHSMENGKVPSRWGSWGR
jgi:hypothetical protein